MFEEDNEAIYLDAKRPVRGKSQQNKQPKFKLVKTYDCL